LGRPTRTTVKGMAQAAGETNDAATRMRRAGSGLPLYHEAVSGKTWPAAAGLASSVAPMKSLAGLGRPAVATARSPVVRANSFARAATIGHRRATASSSAALPIVAAQAKRHFPAETPALRAVKPWRQRVSALV
jgi:hypothetical protein